MRLAIVPLVRSPIFRATRSSIKRRLPHVSARPLTRMSEPTHTIPSSTGSSSSGSSPTGTNEYYLPVPTWVPVAPKQRYWLHGLLLLLTCFTTLVVGARMEFCFQHNLAPFVAGDEYISFFPIRWALIHPSRLLLGVPFSGALLLILLAHEMGHYLYCRYYGVHATLPFFIPAPTLIGTLGAVIRIKSPIRSRAALFDIGIAGPIAGFVVAVVTLIMALLLSKPLPGNIGPSNLRLGFPWILSATHHLLSQVAPNYAISGLPLRRVYLHPTAVAALVGMFATAMNLLPSGQLDGGHIVYALWPRAHRFVSWLTVAVLIYIGQSYVGWWMWAGLLAGMNILTWRQRQAPEYPMLPAWRWIPALLGLAMLALTFTIAPFQILWR
jgi:membrane-associated protease RseP (regulator of RpoE activity)